MKRTAGSTVIVLLVLGGVFDFVGNVLVVAAGGLQIEPSVSFLITIAVIGVVVGLLGWAVRRAVKGRARVNPFRAVRVAALAKACTLCGALLLGACAGGVIFVFTRTVIADSRHILFGLLGVLTAVVLMVGGIVAEYFCTVPPGAGPNDGSSGGGLVEQSFSAEHSGGYGDHG